MPGLEARSLDFDYVIRESLAGLARNLAVAKNLPACDEMCRAMVSDALAGLDASDLHLLDRGDPLAASRAAIVLARRTNQLDAHRNDSDGRLFAGIPLRLADFLEGSGMTDAAVCGGPVREIGPTRIEPNRITVTLNSMTVVLFHDNVFLHRDAAEGPAFSATASGGQLMRALYLTGGVLHRPSNEGPALLEFNAAGDCLFEGYFEHGRLHRDPKLGPAFSTLFAGEGHERFEYFVDGLLHRDEEEGPALLEGTLIYRDFG